MHRGSCRVCSLRVCMGGHRVHVWFYMLMEVYLSEVGLGLTIGVVLSHSKLSFLDHLSIQGFLWSLYRSHPTVCEL